MMLVLCSLAKSVHCYDSQYAHTPGPGSQKESPMPALLEKPTMQIMGETMSATSSKSQGRSASGKVVPSHGHYHRKLQQNIDPLSHQLNKLACVNDTTIYPFNTVGRLYYNNSNCMATLVGPDTIYTTVYCFDANNLTGTFFRYGGSPCSGKSGALLNANAISTFTPDLSGCGNDAFCLLFVKRVLWAHQAGHILFQLVCCIIRTSLEHQQHWSGQLYN